MFVLTLFVLAAMVVPSRFQGIGIGPVGRLDFKRVQDCPGLKSVLKLQLGKDSKGRRVLSAKLDLPEDFTKKFTYQIDVHKWTGTERKTKMQTYKGGLCDHLEKLIPGLRNRVYKLANIKSKCEIKKGKYEAKEIYAVEKDLNRVPAIPYGNFQLDVFFFNGQKKKIGCNIIDIDSLAK